MAGGLLAPTPPMGFNTWNTFGTEINEKLIKETADVMVNEGYLDAGYKILAIDDGWSEMKRSEDGKLMADHEKFPNGMKALADYVHSKGLQFGIYSDAGTMTCASHPGSYGYERVDAQTFADWDVDFVKHDFCFSPAGRSDVMLYRRMGQALRETNRPIIFSGCWGCDGVWKWMRSCGAHMWRLTGDIYDKWESIEKVGFGALGLESYAGPNGWNDPDMLVVGVNGKGYVGQIGGGEGCTLDEYQAHFAMWAILSAPLFLGNDIRDTSDDIKKILLNKEVIAINQDPQGIQAFRIEGWVDALVKPLSDGTIALAVFNKKDVWDRYVVSWEAMGWQVSDNVQVRDVISHEDLGVMPNSITMRVEAHGCRLFRLKRI